MKKVVFALTFILLTALLPITALAAEVPERAEEILGGITEEMALDFSGAVADMWERMKNAAAEPFRAALKNGAAVLSCAIFSSVGENALRKTPELSAPRLAGVLGVTVITSVGINSIIGELCLLISDIRAYSAALLPTIASAAAASGCAVSASSTLATSTLVINLILAAVEKLIVPAIMVYVAVSAASAAFGGQLRGVLALLGKLISWLLIAASAGFSAYLGAQNVVTASADAAAVKAAKTAISSLVPVVGRTISDVSESVAGGFVIVKNTAGAFGILVLIALAYGPVLTAAANYLCYKLAAALSETVAAPELTRLISDIGTAIGFAAAAASVAALALFISVAAFLGMAAG